MKKEELLKRLKLIEMDLQQTTANYNALLGAKSELSHWLKQVEAEEIKVSIDEVKEDACIEEECDQVA